MLYEYLCCKYKIGKKGIETAVLEVQLSCYLLAFVTLSQQTMLFRDPAFTMDSATLVLMKQKYLQRVQRILGKILGATAQ